MLSNKELVKSILIYPHNEILQQKNNMDTSLCCFFYMNLGVYVSVYINSSQDNTVA